MRQRFEGSAQKRFEIATDSYSRERLRVLRETLAEWKQKLPDIHLGLSLFGSLSKGKPLDASVAAQSDIDAHVFLDCDDVARKGQMLPQEVIMRYYHIASDEDKRQWNPKTAWWVLAGLIEADVAGKLHQLTPPVNDGIRVQPISLHHKDSLYDRVYRYAYPDLDNNPEDFVDHFVVAAPWHLDVGGGMRRYRRAFLEDLLTNESPAEREKLWEEVYHCIVNVERLDNIPTDLKKQFPRTFREACHYYGVNLETTT